MGENHCHIISCRSLVLREELEGEKITALAPKYVALESIQEKPTYAPTKPESIKMAGISRVATSPRGVLEWLSRLIRLLLFEVWYIFQIIYVGMTFTERYFTSLGWETRRIIWVPRRSDTRGGGRRMRTKWRYRNAIPTCGCLSGLGTVVRGLCGTPDVPLNDTKHVVCLLWKRDSYA